MHTANLIAQALGSMGLLREPPCRPEPHVCAVTGQECACLPWTEVIGDNFTDAQRLAAPHSPWVSVDVWQVWMHGFRTGNDKKRDKRPERMSSWFVTPERFEMLDRQGVREKVLAANLPPLWAGYATTSYKKHGSLVAPINSTGRRVWAFEQRRVDLSDYEDTMTLWNELNRMLRMGFWRSILETLDCPTHIARDHGWREWFEFMEYATPRHLSAQYAFLCYLLPSQKELKSEVAEVESTEPIKQMELAL